MHGRRNCRPPLSRMRTCYEAFSLTRTIRMYLHFYVTYVIIALHYLTESEIAALKNIRYVKENEK